jgi:hypothetical protein
MSETAKISPADQAVSTNDAESAELRIETAPGLA